MEILNEGQLLFIVLIVLLFYTLRGCWFCWQAFKDDPTGKWITIGELLIALCFIGIIIDIGLRLSFGERHPLVSIAFYISFILAAVGSIVRSEKGFRAIRNTYRKIR